MPGKEDYFIDNLLLKAFLRKDKKEIGEDLENLFRHFSILLAKSEQIAGNLSGEWAGNGSHRAFSNVQA